MCALSLGRFLDRTVYKEFDDRWDDKELRTVALNHITDSSRVLDVGAGVGRVPEMNFRGISAHVTGIDPDERILTNPFLDSALVGLVETVELPHGHFDVVVCDNVFEHVKEPDKFLESINRCMKENGVLIAKTPNRNHYVSLIARLTPLWFHKLYNRLRGRQAEDTFGTYYRLNTERDVKIHCVSNNFSIENVFLRKAVPSTCEFFLFFTLLVFYMSESSTR